MNRKARRMARYVVGWLCWVVPALTLAGCKGGSPTLPQSSCPSLIAHWKMDDPVGSTSITDSVGNHHGALKDCNGNAISIGTGFGPKIVSIIPPTGLGLDFPPHGSNQALYFIRTFAEVNHDNSLNIDPQCGFRIEMWITAGGGAVPGTAGEWFQGIPVQPILDKFDTNNGYALYLDNWNPTAFTWRLVFRLNNSTVALPNFSIFTKLVPILNQWWRVVVKVEPSGTVTLCKDLNGSDIDAYEACNSIRVSSIATTNTNPLWIAATRLFSFNDPATGLCPASLPFHPAATLRLDEVKICGTPNPC